MTSSNPYGISTTIRDPAKFFGRADALRYLFAEISDCRCISIVGTRRSGKSSLLQSLCWPQTQQRFAQYYDLSKHLLVNIDLGEFLSKTREDFFDAVCRQLLIQSRGRLHLTMPTGVASDDAFCLLLEQIRDQGFYTVLLFDAFNKITANPHFDAKFFSFMRAQANHGRVSYVTASIAPLEQCCHPSIEGSPFFNIFNVYRLGPFTDMEAHELIIRPAQESGLPFSVSEAEEIRHLAGRHPFFIHRVAHHRFEAKLQHLNGSFRLHDTAFEDLRSNFEDIWRNSLDSQRRELLQLEARWNGVRQSLVPELGESELFREFVRVTSNVQPVEIAPKELEKILEDLSDVKSLGESELTQLYLFSLRTRFGTLARSTNEKGVVVRRILQDARERLRPEGELSKTAPEWRYYNILNHRYFRDHLRNEALADLLGISVRQFHRERVKAIETLALALKEMEAEACAHSDD